MKKGNHVLVLAICFLFFCTSINAQDNVQTSSGKNQLGIRISSKDAVINHSITYKRFLRSDFALEGLFSFGDPVALGLLAETHKPFGPNGLTWFWGVGAYAAFSGNRKFGAQG